MKDVLMKGRTFNGGRRCFFGLFPFFPLSSQAYTTTELQNPTVLYPVLNKCNRFSLKITKWKVFLLRFGDAEAHLLEQIKGNSIKTSKNLPFGNIKVLRHLEWCVN